MAIQAAFDSVFSIILMVSVGYALAWRRWFDEGITRFIAELVTHVSLPALLFHSIVSTINHQELISLGRFLIVPLVSIIMSYLLGAGISLLIKLPRQRRGTFRTMFFASNTVFMGFPVNVALFGASCLPYAILYYFANTVFFWTLGIREIANDSGRTAPLISRQSLVGLFSPPLVALLLGLLAVLAGLSMPKFIMEPLRMLGDMTTPLSMIFIGATIYGVKPRDISLTLDMAVLMAGRFILSPLLVVLAAYFSPLPGFVRNVFIVQALMPVMANSAIIARSYGADHEYAALMVALSTLLSLAVIPVVTVLL